MDTDNPPQATPPAHPSLAALESAADGLLFPSETDAPLVPFFWPVEGEGEALTQAPLTPARVLELAGAEASAPVKATTLAAFFRPATKDEEWHNEEEKAEAARFKALVELLKSTLRRPQVFRVGETSIDVYIVGAVEGGYAGLKTRVVET